MHHLIIPGLNNSGPDHWQSFWEKSLPDTSRVVQENWDHPEKCDWVSRLSRYISKLDSDTVLVAHSLGVVTAVEWLLEEKNPYVKGAFLVAPPDADSVEIIHDFAPMPMQKLPVPSMVIASTNDPFVTFERAEAFAKAWGSAFVNVGNLGHINAKTHLGEWPEGRRFLAEFEASI
ncbi:MAG: alpha/beta hydrolase [Fibrobacter sp.]|nr:alpha/beta hydrolase [Fibrobacter sp.]